MLVFIVVVTVVAAVVAAVLVARLRKKRLQKRFRLEVANQGNVRSRYQLRAEDPEKALSFRFVVGGNSLPQLDLPDSAAKVTHAGIPASAEALPAGPPPSTKDVPAKGGGARKKADKALTAAGAIAELLSTIGMILPSSMGAPLFQKASQLRQGQIRARRVEQLPDRMTWLKPGAAKQAQAQDVAAPSPAAAQQPVVSSAGRVIQADGLRWVQTPFIQPGETLAVDLLIKAMTSGKSQHRLFQVFSSSVEQENAPLVVEEGSVQIGGGFWTRRVLPYLLIAAAAITILLLAFWLANIGVLA
jgi:hypothetical protein